MSYQGWTNYETWATALWLDNEQGSQYAACELAEETKKLALWQAANAFKDWLEDETPDLGASLWFDLLRSAFEEINWEEIAEHYREINAEDEEE